MFFYFPILLALKTIKILMGEEKKEFCSTNTSNDKLSRSIPGKSSADKPNILLAS